MSTSLTFIASCVVQSHNSNQWPTDSQRYDRIFTCKYPPSDYILSLPDTQRVHQAVSNSLLVTTLPYASYSYLYNPVGAFEFAFPPKDVSYQPRNPASKCSFIILIYTTPYVYHNYLSGTIHHPD